MKTSQALRMVVGGVIGNTTEWYNFFLYSYLAPVISREFFPSGSTAHSLIFTYAIFALSFFVRPLGGILFGWIGDTYGRQRALLLATLMMGAPTALMGLLPVYTSIGLASPLLLLLLRMLQGLSAGGEHTGSAVYLAEHAPSKRLSLWVSTVPATGALGLLLSSLAALFMMSVFSQASMIAWGWRVGYWIGTSLCLISFILRLRLPETPDFEKTRASKSQGYSLLTLMREPGTVKQLLLVFSLASYWGVFYQVLFIWMPTYLSHFQHYSQRIALQMNSLYLVLLVMLILFVGYYSDRIGRRPLLYAANLAMLGLAYPLFVMLSSGELWQVYVAMGVFTVVLSLYVSSSFTSMVNVFPTSVRYTGFSFGFNLGLAVFGGTCPLIVTWLIDSSNNLMAPAFYVMLAAAIALVTCWYLPEKKQDSEEKKRQSSSDTSMLQPTL